ncbi:MAG TPA: hypothetical protein VFE63_22115 [Roseiarcus sp.]|jgi:hypothetical protein|nr:hypothetical protein [Roseiarcus sp.]
MLQNPRAFFDAVRTELYGPGGFDQSQVDGVNAILDAWSASPITDWRWIAYALATAYHETGRAMQPVAERGRGQGRPYGVRCGPYRQVYYGRGFVQLTWLANYEKAEREIPGSDLVRTPDNALKPAIAATILVKGMSDGWFTGKKLADYFPLEKLASVNWLNAREIVNGHDRAAQISAYAVHFHTAIIRANARSPAAPVAKA